MTTARDTDTGSTISTHVLDTALGAPARGIRVSLHRSNERGADVELGAGFTDDDGRVRDLLAAGRTVAEGTYRLRFDTGAYFSRTNREGFFPEVSVTFLIGKAPRHYHVPVLLSPFGYSTYRGS